MPKVITKAGKVKHFAYTEKGKAAAKFAAENEMTKEISKKRSNKY